MHLYPATNNKYDNVSGMVSSLFVLAFFVLKVPLKLTDQLSGLYVGWLALNDGFIREWNMGRGLP